MVASSSVVGPPANMAVKLSVRSVTARAEDARSAPARPAAYGRRSADGPVAGVRED